ncbi:golgin subfamily A member 6-like protein 2 [Zophobas morio]|uniref:golgin subfamily A member 6-like protein 2 n=1 Tax=Zophobas morio TaxID=2755281 RepID=UPI0030839559
MERKKRRNKVVMMGLEIETGEQKQIIGKVTKFLEEKVKVESKVKSAYKIAEKVYVVELENREEKINVMKSKKNLKGSSTYINDDLTKTERIIQNKIKEEATKKRNKGKMVRMGYKKLTVDGRNFKWNEEEGRLKKAENFLVKSQKRKKKTKKKESKQGKGKEKGIKDVDREIGKREAGTKLGEKGVKVLFWNVQRLRKKEEEFWDYVGKFDVVGLVETWVQRENWEKLEETLPQEYVGEQAGE